MHSEDNSYERKKQTFKDKVALFLHMSTLISFIAIVAMVVLLTLFKTIISSALFFGLTLSLSITAALGLLVVAWFLSGNDEKSYLFTYSLIALSLTLGCFTAGVLTTAPVFFIINLSIFCLVELFILSAYFFSWLSSEEKLLLKICFVIPTVLIFCGVSASYVLVSLSLIGLAIPSNIVLFASGVMCVSIIQSFYCVSVAIKRFQYGKFSTPAFPLICSKLACDTLLKNMYQARAAKMVARSKNTNITQKTNVLKEESGLSSGHDTFQT